MNYVVLLPHKMKISRAEAHLEKEMTLFNYSPKLHCTKKDLSTRAALQWYPIVEVSFSFSTTPSPHSL